MEFRKYIEYKCFCPFTADLVNNFTPYFILSEKAFKIEVDPDVECNMDDGSDMTCNEYIDTFDSPPTTEECIVDLHFLYTLRNIGTLCGLVNQVTSIVDKSSTLINSIEGDLILPGDEVDFCPTEELSLKHELVGVNICDLAGHSAPLSLEGFDVEVDLSAIDYEIDLDLEDLDVDVNIEIPEFPVVQCTDTVHEPFEFTFQVMERTCSASNNSQWGDFLRGRHRRAKRNSRSKGKGKGSSKAKDCDQTVSSMPDQPILEIRSTDGKVNFSQNVSYGSFVNISSDRCAIEDLHVMVKDSMGGQVIQQFSIDATQVCIGDTFGSLSLSEIKLGP